MARQPKSTSKAPHKTGLGVEDLVHTGATRKNIPTAEHQSVMDAAQRAPRQARYPHTNAQWLDTLCALHEAGEWAEEGRPSLNRELDPQLIWRGKDQQDWSDLVVNAPPLYIQEKVKPKALIDDLRRLSQTADNSAAAPQPDQAELFGDFNGLPEGADRTEFYQHEGHWQNRLILGDSLQVMASLAEREGLRGQVQCIYFDPPYGIKFNSNFQWSTTSRDVKDGNASHPVYGNIAHGFVYQRVPHITLKAIANNAEIDVIWDKYEAELAPLRAQLTSALPKGWLAAYRKAQKYTAEVPAQMQEWEVPREFPEDWPQAARALHEAFWQQRIARQKEIDASIAAKAEFEYLYDKPCEDRKKVRVAGPFTVESLSPHRVLGVDEQDRLIDQVEENRAEYGQDFASLILENLRTAGVQQAHKADKIEFTALAPWPGELICAEGRYPDEAGASKRAGIFIGPEFGTVTRVDLVDAAREAGEAGFDVLIACAFNYDAQASELGKLGRIHILKARMNADLHMAEDLKNTGKGNLFVIFGEPDVDVLDTQGRSIRRYEGGRDIIDVPADGQLVVKICGVDVFDPASGEVRSDSADGIACWFLDTDYNEESFFVRHAYFLGAGDPYKVNRPGIRGGCLV